MFEISVVVRGEGRKLEKKDICYKEDIVLKADDHFIYEIVQEAIKEFQGSPEDAYLKIKMVVK